LAATYSGAWALFPLPQKWVQAHLAGRDISAAYVVLRPPHAKDVAADYAPCDPPQRVVLGIQEKDGLVREHLSSCLYYCAPGDTSQNLYKGLWGSLTHLSGISLSLASDDSLEITEYYQKKAFVPPALDELSPAPPNTPVESELRTHKQRVDAAQFQFSGRSAGSCIALEEADLP